MRVILAVVFIKQKSKWGTEKVSINNNFPFELEDCNGLVGVGQDDCCLVAIVYHDLHSLGILTKTR